MYDEEEEPTTMTTTTMMPSYPQQTRKAGAQAPDASHHASQAGGMGVKGGRTMVKVAL